MDFKCNDLTAKLIYSCLFKKVLFNRQDSFEKEKEKKDWHGYSSNPIDPVGQDGM